MAAPWEHSFCRHSSTLPSCCLVSRSVCFCRLYVSLLQNSTSYADLEPPLWQVQLYKSIATFCLTASLSVAPSLPILTAIFPGEPGLASFIEAKDDGSSGDIWSYKTCKSPVKSSSPTNQYPTFFTGRMPFLSPNQQCQSTEGKISHSKDLLTQAHPGVFQLRLWPLKAPGYLPCHQPLMPAPLVKEPVFQDNLGKAVDEC